MAERKRYRTIVADPPWSYESRLMGYDLGARPMPYPTMTIDEIAALPVGDLAMPGAHLYLWTTQRYIWDAPSVMCRWGFSSLKVLTWCKPPMGRSPGGTFSNTTEFCVFGRAKVGAFIRRAREAAGLSQDDLDISVRGRVTRLSKRWEDDDCFPLLEDWRRIQDALPTLTASELTTRPELCPTTWWEWPRSEHSAKPPAFLDLVERISPGPHLELFARTQRLGWDTWGNEALNHVTL